MSHSCYIIDDEGHAIEVLESYIVQTPGLKLIGQSTNPVHGVEAIFSGKPPELLFLDVDMPQMNGLDVAALLPHETAVIFTTSFREYAPDAFDQDAVDYLLKPFNYPRFLKAVNKFKAGIKNYTAGDEHLLIKSNVKGKFSRILVSEIRFIENIGNYITIHLETEKITTYLTLAEIMTKLPESCFSRIHQSFIVNHKFIRSVEYGQLKLAGEVVLPIGGTYRAAFREKMRQEIVTSKRDPGSG